MNDGLHVDYMSLGDKPSPELDSLAVIAALRWLGISPEQVVLKLGEEEIRKVIGSLSRSIDLIVIDVCTESNS